MARQEPRQDDALRAKLAAAKAKIKREVAVHGVNRGQHLECYSLGGFHNVHVQLAMQEEFDLEIESEIVDTRHHRANHYRSPNFVVEVDVHTWARDLTAEAHPKDPSYTTTDNRVKTSWLELNPMDGPLEDLIAAHTYSHNVRKHSGTSVSGQWTSSVSTFRAIRNVPDTIAFRVGTETLAGEPQEFRPSQRSGVNPKTLAKMRKHYKRPEYFRTRPKGGLATVEIPESLPADRLGIPTQPGFETGDTYQLVGMLLSNVHGVADKLATSGPKEIAEHVVDTNGKRGTPWDLPSYLRQYVPVDYEMAVRMVSTIIPDHKIAHHAAHAALALLALVNEGLPFLPEGAPLPTPRPLTVNAFKLVEQLDAAGGKAKHLRMLCAVAIDKGKEGAWSDWLLLYTSSLTETRPEAADAFHKHLMLADNARRNAERVAGTEPSEQLDVLGGYLAYGEEKLELPDPPPLPCEPGPSEAAAASTTPLPPPPAESEDDSESEAEPEPEPATEPEGEGEPPHTQFLNEYFLCKPGMPLSPNGREWFEDLPGVCEALTQHIPNLAPPLASLQRLSPLFAAVDETTGRPIFVALMVFRMLCVHHRDSIEARTDRAVRSCMDMLKASLTKILEYNVHECLWSAFIETMLEDEPEPPKWVAAAIDGYGVQLARANVQHGLYEVFHTDPAVKDARPTISLAKARRLKKALLKVPNVDGMVSTLVDTAVAMMRYMYCTSCTAEFYAVKERVVMNVRKLAQLCTPAWLAMEVSEILLAGEQRYKEWKRLWRPMLEALEATELEVPMGPNAPVWVLHLGEMVRAIQHNLKVEEWCLESKMKKNDELRKELEFLKKRLDERALAAEAQPDNEKPGLAEVKNGHFNAFADRVRAKAIVYALYNHKAYFLGPWRGTGKGSAWHEVECVQQMGAYDAHPIRAPPKKLVLGASPKGDRRTAILYYRRRSNMQLEDEATEAMAGMVTRAHNEAVAKEMLNAFSYSVFLQKQLFNYGNRAMNRLDAIKIMHECSSIFQACANKEERVSMAWAFRNNITTVANFDALKNLSRAKYAKAKKNAKKPEEERTSQPPSPTAPTPLTKAEERRLAREKARVVEAALAPEREKQAARAVEEAAAKAEALKAERDALREASAAKREKASAVAKAAADAEDAKAKVAARAAARVAEETKAAATAAKAANNARKKGATPVHSDEAERLLRLEEERDAATKNAEWEAARRARTAVDTAQAQADHEAWLVERAATAAANKARKKAEAVAKKAAAKAAAEEAERAKAEAEAAAEAKAKKEQEEWAATWEAVARAQREEAAAFAEKRARAEAAAKAEAEAEAVRAVQRERLRVAAAARAAEGMAVARAAAAAAERERIETPTAAANTNHTQGARGGGGRGGRGRGRGRGVPTAPPALPPPAAEAQEECIICHVNEKTHACYPCGHVCFCVGCVAIADPIDRPCPVCRAPVVDLMRVYFN